MNVNKVYLFIGDEKTDFSSIFQPSVFFQDYWDESKC